MAKGILRLLAKARKNVHRDIVRETDRSNKYSVGMAYEGYKGGYLQALDDVVLALDGGIPQRKGWWEDDPPERSGKKAAP